MAAKSEHLQIRVTARQKALLKRAAAAAGQDLSTYVLARAIPPAWVKFAELLTLLGEGADHRYPLTELNDFLTALGPAELHDAVEHAEMDRLSPFLRNYVAAMVEQASAVKHVQAPTWTREVSPL